MTDHTPSPATDDQVYCCVACRAEGWACPALCQRPCCGAEIAATQNEACACGHARFMHGDTTGDTGCRGCRCESWRPVPPSPLDDLCCNGEGCSRCATPSPATDGLREAAVACEHFYAWVSPAGTRHGVPICTGCHQPDPAWLNETFAHPAPPSETATEVPLCTCAFCKARDAAVHTPPVSSDEDRAEEGVRLSEKWRSASEAARKSEHHFPADCLAEAADVYDALVVRLAEVEQERDAFKRQYNVGFREWQQAHTEAAREKARADALAEQVAAVGALADRLEAPATKMQIISADPAPSIRQVIGAELRAILAAHPAPPSERDEIEEPSP